MTYVKQTWANGIEGETPINAARLNHIETGIEATARKNERLFDVQEHSSWDPIAADNDAALTAKLSDASLAGGGGLLVPEEVRIASDHLIPQGVNLLGFGGGHSGSSSKFLCTTTNSRISYGDITTGRFGGLSSGFTVDGNNIAINPFYIGIDVGRTFVNIDVIDATDTNLVMQGSQNNSFINFNTSGGLDQIHLERGASTNLFLRCEFNDSNRYHALIRANGAAPIPVGTNVPGFNHFIRCIFERGQGGVGTVIFRQEAGLNNMLDSCVLADGSEAGGVTAIPTILQIIKSGAEPSTNLILAGDTTLQSNIVSVSSVGLNLGDGCTVVNNGTTHFVGSAIGIQHNTSGYLVDVGWLDLSAVTTPTSGPAFYANVLIQQRRGFASIYTRPAAETAIGVIAPGDAAARMLIYGNGTIHTGDGTIAPAKVLGPQGAAVADATDAASAITQLNLLLARLRAATGHGLIA